MDAVIFEETRIFDMVDVTDSRSRLDVRAADEQRLAPFSAPEEGPHTRRARADEQQISWADLMTASGHSHGRHWAVFRGRRQTGTAT